MATEGGGRPPTRGGDVDSRLQRSRLYLRRHSTGTTAGPARPEIYRLYEHLHLLSEKANALQEELEKLKPPVSITVVQTQYVASLQEIRSDLSQFYWGHDSLLQQLADDDEFAWTVFQTVRALRHDWAELQNALDVYFEDRQPRALSERRIASGSAFRLQLLAFVEALSSIGNSPALLSRIDRGRASGRRHGASQGAEEQSQPPAPGGADPQYRMSSRRLAL